ncbi:transketolase [Roseimaritima ulvae]|uniref:Transketolase 2 n=1 Tax=Roseimaritima ulvae TaxID=980254 RepID=A0A5B9QIC8_9BACT|nr:transketolase [Roseimaritima ulvae]QEG38768.1 Transketolase 2 [Roseimaritima ulvae]
MTTATHRDIADLQQISKQIRRWIVRSTSEADSGHPTSSLSAVELMVDLMFGGHFRFDLEQPDNPANDRLIFSKGHASPLFYALWAAAGEIEPDALMHYREFGSRLEGHPTARFPRTEAATGSLGQGLSIGLGMALSARYLDRSPARSFVLLGDSEMAEGSQWEAFQLAAHYKLDNLIGILDVNRLGQRGETMYGHDLQAYRQRIAAFGWRCIEIEDGHEHDQVLQALEQLDSDHEHPGQPTMLIARTIKGKGVPKLEDEPGHHGKPVDEEAAQNAFDDFDLDAKIDEHHEAIRGTFAAPPVYQPQPSASREADLTTYQQGDQVATRDAYGNALLRLAAKYPRLVALDGEVCNSTRSKRFRDQHPDRFFEMYIAEQNMVGAATGMALRGKVPFVSTFAAFLTRAFDQTRMARHSDAAIKFVGSHCGVSIGQDGPSQMGLEDIAMFRTIQNGVVLYPCDAVATEACVDAMAQYDGIAYLRTTRGETPVIYDNDEAFPIGGSKVVRRSDHDHVTLIAAGITLHESLRAHDILAEQGIRARVIDLYSIKPLDHATVREAADQTRMIFTVEDHVPEGGLGEAILTSLSDHPTPVNCLAVRKRPLSGAPQKLLDDQGISADKIVELVTQVAQAKIGLDHNRSDQG